MIKKIALVNPKYAVKFPCFFKSDKHNLKFFGIIKERYSSMKPKIKLKKPILISIIIFIFIILIIFLTTKLLQNSIIKPEVHHLETKEHYTLKIDYPENINSLILNNIKEDINQKKKEFLSLAQDAKEDNPYDFQVTNIVTSYQDYYFIHVQIFSYTGGAHYIREDLSYYYQANNNELINLSCFLKNEESLNKLSHLAYYYTIEYGKNNNKNFDEQEVKEGTNPNYENFKHFSLKEEGLEILFPPYQVSCWADGEIKITIPYNELSEILKEEFIITKELPDNSKITRTRRSLEEFKDKKLIAFTFDDGPGTGTSTKLLDSLDKYNARVTFFVLGSRVNQYKDTIIKAYEQGNSIGSHTYSHLNLYKLTDYEILKEVRNTNEEIKKIIGEEPIFLRPPYGNINASIKELTNMYTILWNIDTEDWKYKDKNKIANNIIKNAHDGAIVLLHDIYNTSIEGALIAMETLSQEGYAFVTIEEMFELKGISYDKTKSYFNFR